MASPRHDSTPTIPIDQTLLDEAMQLMGQYSTGDLEVFQEDEKTLLASLAQQEDDLLGFDVSPLVSTDALCKTIATAEEMMPSERPESAALERPPRQGSKRVSRKSSECPLPCERYNRNSKVMVDIDRNGETVRLTAIYVHDGIKQDHVVICLPNEVEPEAGGKDICGMWELHVDNVHPFKPCANRFRDGVCLECEDHTGDCYFCKVPDGSRDVQPVLMANPEKYMRSHVPPEMGAKSAQRYAKDMLIAFISEKGVYADALPISACNAGFVWNLFAMHKWRKEQVGKDDFFPFVRRFLSRNCVTKQTPANCYNPADEHKWNANGCHYSVINKLKDYKDEPEKVAAYADAWKMVFTSTENPDEPSPKKKRARQAASPPPPQLASNPFLPMPDEGFV